MNNKHTRCELIVHGKEHLGDAITDEISLLINHICQIKKKKNEPLFFSPRFVPRYLVCPLPVSTWINICTWSQPCSCLYIPLGWKRVSRCLCVCAHTHVCDCIRWCWGETPCKQAKELWLCLVTKRLDGATYIIIVDQQAQIYVREDMIHGSILRILSA